MGKYVFGPDLFLGDKPEPVVISHTLVCGGCGLPIQDEPASHVEHAYTWRTAQEAHPVRSDDVTPEGIAHIRGCEECQTNFRNLWGLIAATDSWTL